MEKPRSSGLLSFWMKGLLLTVDAETIVENRQRAVSIDRKMQGLMHQEVIPRTLADNPKVVYERKIRLTILQRILEALQGNASRLILGAAGLSAATDALWLEMEVAADVVAIDGERNQGVQGTAKVYDLPGTACGAGNEDRQTDNGLIVDLYHRIGRDDQNRQYGNQAHHDSGDTGFHGNSSSKMGSRGSGCLPASVLCVVFPIGAAARPG